MNFTSIVSLQAYGTSEGVRKAWDERGRGRKFLSQAIIKREVQRLTPVMQKVADTWEKSIRGLDRKAVITTSVYPTGLMSFKTTSSQGVLEKTFGLNVFVEGKTGSEHFMLGFGLFPEGNGNAVKIQDSSLPDKWMGKGIYTAGLKVVTLNQESHLNGRMYVHMDTNPKAWSAIAKHVGLVKASTEKILGGNMKKTKKKKRRPDDLKGYGTPEGVQKAWDSRGRGGAVSKPFGTGHFGDADGRYKDVNEVNKRAAVAEKEAGSRAKQAIFNRPPSTGHFGGKVMSAMKAGDQVTLKEVRRNAMGGASVKVLRFGNILKIEGEKGQEKADVVFASANPAVSRLGGFGGSLHDTQQTRKWVPLTELELVSSRYGGRNVVQVDPNRRGIGQLLSK